MIRTPLQSIISVPREPDFVLGPLALVAAWALTRAARQRKPAFLAVAVAVLAAEFGWPTYARFKRKTAALTVLAHYRNT